MKYLKSYKESLDQDSIDKDIESLFQSIKDYSNVRIGKVGKSVNESKDSDDDVDTMAFYQLFDSDFFIAFEYRDILIKDIKDIKDLIEYYNKTYNENNEWSGGPVNKDFDNYFIDKYKKILGDIFEFKSKPWKPSFKIIFKTDYGYLPVGFSLISKKVYTTYANTISLEEFEKMESDIIRLKKCEVSKRLDTYSNLVISEMISFLSNYRKKTIYDLTYDLNLKIDFDWEWEK